ncbi:MAG: hypothetical protein RIR26_470 [Pseudomonadota bacterium]|jgi:tRNA-dihydrouridine synthase
MEGVTDFATRLWITQTGAPDGTTTPFLRVTKDYPPKRISATFLPELELSKEHGIVTCVPQLMASSTSDLIRLGEFFLSKTAFIDINCGCPSPTVVGHGAGSSLLETPDRFYRYLSDVTRALGASRVSVKMRVGFFDEKEFPELIEVVRSFPLARLTVHGRTRTDRYTGLARWHHIDVASRLLQSPVVGSGDVLDVKTYRERVSAAPQAAGVMIGRGALRNPWIFSSLKNAPSSVVVERSLLLARVLQFVLLQDLQANHWPAFFNLVKEGFFNAAGSMCGRTVSAQNEKLAGMIYGNQTDPLPPSLWPVTRVSLSRGKMLWNYLRSGLAAPATLSVPILRSGSWCDFIDGLEKVLACLPEDNVGVGYDPSWDWVYAGAGSSGHSAKVEA